MQHYGDMPPGLCSVCSLSSHVTRTRSADVSGELRGDVRKAGDDDTVRQDGAMFVPYPGWGH